MKPLLTISAAIESATGLALLVAPSAPASLLLGSRLETTVESTIARIAGAGLLALGIACWLARDNAVGARTLVMAMLFYNTAAAAVLIHAALGLGVSTLGLWPIVVLHLALAIWCIACLRSVNQR
jgi:NhaP-type Na+/H+ and K+/H+ antiporter